MFYFSLVGSIVKRTKATKPHYHDLSPYRILLTLLVLLASLGRSNAQQGLQVFLDRILDFFSSETVENIVTSVCPSFESFLAELNIDFSCNPGEAPVASPVSVPAPTPVAAPTKKEK